MSVTSSGCHGGGDRDGPAGVGVPDEDGRPAQVPDEREEILRGLFVAVYREGDARLALATQARPGHPVPGRDQQRARNRNANRVSGMPCERTTSGPSPVTS
jgi:hypothetical protein